MREEKLDFDCDFDNVFFPVIITTYKLKNAGEFHLINFVSANSFVSYQKQAQKEFAETKGKLQALHCSLMSLFLLFVFKNSIENKKELQCL